MSKIYDLLASRRFWVAIAGVVFVVTEYFGLPLAQEQIESIFLIVMAWIVGDSIRSTERRSGPGPLCSLAYFVFMAGAAVTTLNAQDIDAPENVKPYRLIQARAVGDKLDGFAWIVRRLPDGMRPDLVRMEDGRVAVWTGPPGTYDVDLICQKDGSLAQAYARVTILAPGPPEPGPGPGPEPDPRPDDKDSVPEDEFGNLGRLVYRLAAANATADFPFKDLAELYSGVAQRLEGQKTPILPTITAASEALVEGQVQLLNSGQAAIWLECRVEIGKVWDEYKQTMDRTKAARFYQAVSNGLTGHAT